MNLDNWDTDLLIVHVTVPNETVGRQLSQKLISSRTAACVSTIPGITSLYHWEGKIEESSELLLIIKTTRDLYPDLQRMVIENHPYQNPEIVATPVKYAAEKYAGWIRAETARTL